MITRAVVALGALLAVRAGSAKAQEPSPATFSTGSGTVRFWQTNYLSGGQGACIVKFGFEGRGLPDPIERLTLSIRVITRAGVDLGVASLSLIEPLGGPRADEYRDGTFEGPSKWPHQDDGAPSPLCDEGVTLVVEAARGRQAGRVVDLVRFRQLTLTTLPRLKVKIKE